MRAWRVSFNRVWALSITSLNKSTMSELWLTWPALHQRHQLLCDTRDGHQIHHRTANVDFLLQNGRVLDNLLLKAQIACFVVADLASQRKRSSAENVRAARSVTGFQVADIATDAERSSVVQRCCTREDLMTVSHRANRVRLLQKSRSTLVDVKAEKGVKGSKALLSKLMPMGVAPSMEPVFFKENSSNISAKRKTN